MMSITDLSSTGMGSAITTLGAGGGTVPLPCRVPQPHDHEEFMRLCDPTERARLRELGVCFAEIERAKNIEEGAAIAAGRRRHLDGGWSAKTLANLYRLWRNGGHKPGDWKKEGPAFPPRDFRGLMRAYKPSEEGLPEDFVLFCAQTFAAFRGRDDAVRAWHRHLVREIWLAGQPVPGYGTAAEWYAARGRVLPHGLLVRPGDLPKGWSEDNLRRHLPKRKAVRAQLAHGYLAAHTHQPDQVLGDRSQLRPFERIFLDDLRPDLRCLYLNGSQGEIVYPLLVLGLDCASGVDVANCAKPRALKDPAAGSGARHGITRDMTLRVIVETLRRWGLPPYPITFVQENAAACVSSEDRALIEDAFGDRIQFEDTGVFRERMSTHGFVESGGCPWDKAPLESFFRVLQTQLAALRGSTGPRYDEKHGELAAIEEYSLAMVDAAKGVRELLAQLRTPLLRFDAAHDAIERALRLLRFRDKHALQGFERVVEAQLPDGRWLPELQLAALPAEEQEQAKIISRLEVPAERFVRLLQGVTFDPVDPDLLSWIEGPRFRVTVRAGKIEHKVAARDNVALTFREPGHTLLDDENEGRTFEAALAPDASRIVLGDEGRLVGSILRQDRVNIADRDAVRREMGRVRAARALDREQLAGYLANQDTADQGMREHNDTVLAAAQIETPAAPQIPAAAPEAPAPQQQRARDLSRLRAQAARRAEAASQL